MIIAVHEGEIRFLPEDSEEWIYGVVGVGFVQIANNRVTLWWRQPKVRRRSISAGQRKPKNVPWNSFGRSRAIQEYYRSSASLSRAMSRLKWQNDSTVDLIRSRP